MSNTFGKIIKVHLFGASHDNVVGVVIEGIPAGINIIEDDFIEYINRRKGGSVVQLIE